MGISKVKKKPKKEKSSETVEYLKKKRMQEWVDLNKRADKEKP